MRTLVVIAAAGLVAVAMVWLNAVSQLTTKSSVSEASLTPSISPISNATKVPTVSIWEMHNQAHLENLPIQEIEDRAVVFATKSDQ
jgi:hypothetical protein